MYRELTTGEWLAIISSLNGLTRVYLNLFEVGYDRYIDRG